MDKSLEALVATLKSHGYSITKSRKSVFMALLDREPQSIAELTKSIGDTVDRASIYRTLELFEALNIVERLPIGWKHKFELSDTFTAHHHHATCIRCGKTVPFEESDALKLELKKHAEAIGFIETSHQFEIRGICSACHKKQPPSHV
jgi:Fe2+ or Zn2+ uptake regulation protein